MQDAFGMCGLQRVGNVNGHVQQSVKLQRMSVNQAFENLPLHQLHDQEGPAIGFSDVVHRADIRMVQCGGGFGFAAKRSSVAGSLARFSGRNLIATKRSSRVSSALNTIPIPPPPSCSTMR